MTFIFNRLTLNLYTRHFLKVYLDILYKVKQTGDLWQWGFPPYSETHDVRAGTFEIFTTRCPTNESQQQTERNRTNQVFISALVYIYIGKVG